MEKFFLVKKTLVNKKWLCHQLNWHVVFLCPILIVGALVCLLCHRRPYYVCVYYVVTKPMYLGVFPTMYPNLLVIIILNSLGLVLGLCICTCAAESRSVKLWIFILKLQTFIYLWFTFRYCDASKLNFVMRVQLGIVLARTCGQVITIDFSRVLRMNFDFFFF